MQQLGCDYDDSQKFGMKVKGVLRKIKAVQPNLIVKQEKGGIRIHPSRPAIAPAPRGSRAANWTLRWNDTVLNEDSPLNPLTQLLGMIVLGVVAISVLVIVTKIATAPTGTVPAKINAFKDSWNKIIEPHRTVLKVLCYLFIGLFVLDHVTKWGRDFFDFSALTKFAGYCEFFCWFAGFGILVVFGAGAQERVNLRQRAGMAAIFGPKRIMEIKTGDIYGPAAFSEQGEINQTGTSTTVHEQVLLHKQIHSLMDIVQAEPDSPRKTEALAQMDTLADQVLKPPERRDPSRIAMALERIPKLLSMAGSAAKVVGSAAAAWAAWEKVVPVIKAHLGL